MAWTDRIAAELPLLRRYARALTGSQPSGDAFVRATLEAALADEMLRARIAGGRVALYTAFSTIWQSGQPELADAGEVGEHEQAASARLARITPRHRQALLLTTLEDFSAREAAAILQTDEAEISALVAQAVAEIESQTRTEVLIIEDEPLIAMQLEDIVAELGHGIAGTAATHAQAASLFAQHRPGLVLADIQLADGSSGIEAVEEILTHAQVPVIFITAYPEKLLTGERPEPTYLVTKPFREETVRAAISQALFFGSSKPL